jgi:hypothetical protein
MIGSQDENQVDVIWRGFAGYEAPINDQTDEQFRFDQLAMELPKSFKKTASPIRLLKLPEPMLDFGQ